MPRSARTVPRDRGPSDETLVPAGANAAFRALDAAEVRWCVLRGEPAAAEPDIDLLVPSDDMERAERALGSAGF
ncbi:MAG: nucleotidyltransferase family protein, partial [Chloroflexi bacterium]|nr:nucleotidyltransferase family protein [Chloroflexota bacterium]